METLTINLFYPLLFLTIIVFIVTIGIVIKANNSDFTFKNIFFKSSDNAKEVTIDTTTKMANMHDTVVEATFGVEHELELDTIEKKLKKLDEDVQELKEQVKMLVKKVFENQ